MALRTEFAAALNQAASERGLDVQEIVGIIKEAVLAAYRKSYGVTLTPEEEEAIEVDVDALSGTARVIKDGQDITPTDFGRIAAQTAKQVLLQRIREAEKGAIMTEFEKRIGTIANGMIQRIEGSNIVVDLGRTEAIMPAAEQIPSEQYRLNQRLKVYISGLRETPKGQEIVVSRSHKGLVDGLFKLEVPEIGSGVVEIKGIVREAGTRTKVAVASRQEGVDPVGSCVGQKGVRVQAVIAELGNEKIDVVAFNDDPVKFIIAALSPAKVDKVKTNDKTKEALVDVPEDQLSLAIGKEGQNVRLASKLTGWKIDINGAAVGGHKDKAKAAEGGEDKANKKPAKKVTKKTKAEEVAVVEKPKKAKKVEPTELKQTIVGAEVEDKNKEISDLATEKPTETKADIEAAINEDELATEESADSPVESNEADTPEEAEEEKS